ncbi:hypothetical protein BDW74DRAFT_187155 [Aspergillus multicolor]|uniref:putative NRPS-like enzyme n=1 Tax=Aspergillus multicolor TaxID=41759 RepID=UPI003CCDCD5B
MDADLFRQFGFGPRSAIPFATVHEAFIHHATRIPSETALRDLTAASPRDITYGELLRQSQFIATQLKQYGVTPGSRVLLLSRRSTAMIAGILGILMAGAQYIPMDGGVVPDHTLQRAVEQSGATVALCHQSFKGRLSSIRTLPSPLVLEDLLGGDEYTRFDLNAGRLLCDGDGKSGCYIIYTSGTTGEPKGVNVTHRNVTNILCQRPGNLCISRGSKVGHVLAVSFDMGAWEVLGTLVNGGTLVLRGSDWTAALKEIHTLICTPSMLARYNPEDFPNIRCVATADRWAASATFYNCCGPTETTIVNTMHKHIPGVPVTIGKPTPNNNVYILDGDKKLCPIGEVGTIWAGGAGVTQGYVGHPEKTVERYHCDAFANDGSMMYNTGDLARWLPDGSLATLGRNDDQVKIRGFRVELEGVAACIASCPNVHQAAALMIDGELTGYLTPRTCDSEAIQEHLKSRLPYYAIPCHWHTMDGFPLTPSGKLDKRALAQHQEGIPKLYPIREKSDITSSTVFSSSASSSLQKEPPPLAAKKHGKPWRGLRHRIFIVYRKLFSLVILANIAMLICLLTTPIECQHITTVAFVNLTIAILVRQDMVINTLYAICCSVPTSWPLAIRKRCAKIYHLGGVHSSAAVMAVSWYTGGICYNINALVNRPNDPLRPSTLTITLSLIALSIFIIMITFAYPTLRKRHHNLFERVHRFGGWTALVIIWVQTICSIRDQRPPTHSLGHAIITTPAFWMLITITLSIASSWIFLRSVPVDAEVLSNHAVRLHFSYTVPVNGTFTRLSQRPLLEWHSFAPVPAPDATNGREKGYNLVVSRAGDWTGHQISKPPTKIWVRGIPTSGVMRIAPLFTRLVLIATGSGIGPLLGHIQRPTCPYRLIWSTPSPVATFGQEIVDEVYCSDPGAIVHDTKVLGRPDLVRMAWDAVQGFAAEGVVVISNEKVTKKIVYGLETRGVAAYGAIWDS